MRKPVIAGNWKMHHAPDEARRFFGAFRPSWSGAQPDILIFPSAISFAAAQAALPDHPRVQLGVQNIHPEPHGAFTGELSAPMARAAGATHALAGHSERRHLFGESDQDAAARA
ncbi:MAG: triose-phosphate isomerase, partial [Gammaproteobacteria bacterium]|nr:triose-phosphate isomerase [Gammaproteobacteria bacterium]